MKRDYNNCILSIIIFLLGMIGILIILFLKGLDPTTESTLLLLGLCSSFVGLTAFAIYNKKYAKIKALKTDSSLVISHWYFTPHSSEIIDHALLEQKNNALATTIMCFILGLVFAITFALSKAPYMTYVAIGVGLFSLICLIGFSILIHKRYKLQVSNPSEVIFGKDYIYYLDEIYSLSRSIYLLEDILLSEGDELSLKFLYGQSDTENVPVYTLEIPIPSDKVLPAKYLQKYYLTLIDVQ